MITAQRRRIFRLMFVPLWLIGCVPGPTASFPSPRLTASPTATAPAPATLIVLAVPDRVAPPDQPIRIVLLRPDGAEVDHFNLKPGVQVIAAAGTRIFVSSGGHLKTVEPNGSVVDFGLLGTSGPGRVVPSPDGTRWVWSTYTANGNSVHSVVHLGGDGMQPRVVEDVTEDIHVLAPFAWTARGVFVQHSPMGIGGYILFAPAFGPVDRLDPVTWTVVAEPRTTTCAFSDEAADGTIACLPRQQARQLALIKSSGSQRTVDLPLPQYTQDGDAYFDPTGKRVTIGGASGVGADGKPEQYSSGVVTVATGALTPIGPPGVRPAMGSQCWLPDGRLVLWRPPNAAGGPAGIYVVDQAGNGPFIQTAGTPIGQTAALA